MTEETIDVIHVESEEEKSALIAKLIETKKEIAVLEEKLASFVD